MNTSGSPNGTSHKFIDLTKAILPTSINTKFLNGSLSNNNNLKNSNHTSQFNFITSTINNFMVNHGLISTNSVTNQTNHNGTACYGTNKRLSSSPQSSSSSHSLAKTAISSTSCSSPRRSKRLSDVSSNCGSVSTATTATTSHYSSSISCDSSENGTLSTTSNNSNTYITNSFSSSASSISSSCSSSEDNHEKRSSNSFMNTSSENSTCGITTRSSSLSRITRSSQKTSSSSSSSIPMSLEENSQTNSAKESSNLIRCQWTKCKFATEEIDDKLIEHIKTKHILTQRCFRQFRCLWKDCNVYGNPSCSFNWLERHVIDHVDQKPFTCILNGCKKRFRTEALLEKHVQSHINEPNNVNSYSNGNNNSNSTNNGLHSQSNSVSPNKTRNNLLKTAKMALIENLKNKNSSSSQLSISNSENNLSKSNSFSVLSKQNSSANLVSSSSSKTTNGLTSSHSFPNYSQILKTLTKKRKNLANNDTTGRNKFKKAQYKDYLDPTSFKIIDKKLKLLNYESGKVSFHAKIIASKVDTSTNQQSFLVEWEPGNILKNEWLEKDKLTVKKTVTLSELFTSCDLVETNPFYRRHRFRPNRRK